MPRRRRTALEDGVTFDTATATAEVIRDEDLYPGVRVTMAARLSTGSRSGAVCGLRSGAAARKDAELVPLWVGKHDPTLIALTDVGVSGT